MNRRREILIVAGEVSGDMHAARLVRAVRERDPDVHFFGVGGDDMRAAGAEIIYDVKDMAVMGFSEVLRRFGFFRRVFFELLALARERQPDAVLLVDYPGFNLRFASRARRLGLKIIYYICPQVWAWNRSRIPGMARSLDRLITIFPFEAKHFDGTGLRVEFAGHPLVDEARRARAEPMVELPWGGGPRAALLPGSREHEIARILPVMWRAAARLSRADPAAAFIVASPSPTVTALLRRHIERADAPPPRNCEIVTGRTRQVLRQANAAMVASGTATIEAALMGCPMCVVYRTAPLTYAICKVLVQVDYIGMVNIVAGRELCPELIQNEATETALAAAMTPLLTDTSERRQMVDGLREVADALGTGNADQRAAEIVLDEMRPRERLDAASPSM